MSSISEFGPLASTERWYWPSNFCTIQAGGDEECEERFIGLKFEFDDGTELNLLMRPYMASTLASGMAFEVSQYLIKLKEEELGLEDDVI